jgi:hypothetical protein
MSDLRVNTISASDGTSPVTLTKQSAAKAWAETNAAGTSILGSFGFSSMTDIGAGKQQMFLSNAMTTNRYARLLGAENVAVSWSWTDTPTTTSFIHYFNNESVYIDGGVHYGVLGDLA